MKKIITLFLLLYCFSVAKAVFFELIKNPPKNLNLVADFDCDLDSLCLGTSINFSNQSENESMIFWDFGDGWTSELTNNPQHLYDTAGIYKVRLTARAEDGTENYKDTTIKVFENPEFDIVFDGDTIIMQDDILNANVTGGFTNVIWQHWTGNLQGANVELSQAGDYTVKVVNEKYCSNTKQFNLIVLAKDNIKPMTVITPNEDGFNDYFQIENIDFFSTSSVCVYNRWGDEVYKSKGKKYTNEEAWDGKNDGKELPTGTYYYVIKCGENNITFKGAVNILK